MVKVRAGKLMAVGIGGILLFDVASATAPSSQLDLLEQTSNGHLSALQLATPQLTESASRDIAGMILAASRLQEDRVRTLLQRYVARNDGNARREVLAWSVAANSAFASGDYQNAVIDADRWMTWSAMTASTQVNVDATNLRSTAAALASLPSQQLVESSPKAVATVRDQAGLLRAEAKIGSENHSVVLDTGANVSTISMSAAGRLGLHLSEREASVASGTRDAVKARVGYADSIEIAGVRLVNVAFLVLDDDMLAVPITGYTLDVILGFPVFRAMERVRFTESTFLPFAPSSTVVHAAPLHFDGNNLFVTTRVNGRTADLQLDSGAPVSSLSSSFAARNAELLKKLDRRASRSVSAGGASTTDVVDLPHAVIKIGACSVALPNLSIAIGTPSPLAPDGALGQDALAKFTSHTIDWKRGALEMQGPPC